MERRIRKLENLAPANERMIFVYTPEHETLDEALTSEGLTKSDIEGMPIFRIIYEQTE